MIQDLKKYLLNKELASTDCEQLLGTDGAVQQFAQLWKLHKEKFKLAESSLLLDFCKTQKFSDNDLHYFRLGLHLFPKLLESCLSEIETKSTSNQAE